MARGAGRDPRTAGPIPPFPAQEQAPPGQEHAMRPRPDFGEASYKGRGRLTGRIALITGADSGIGRAVALAFAREGARLLGSYLSEHRDAEETQRVVQASGGEVQMMAGDLADEAHCRDLVRRTVERYGRIDILVNNAAYQGQRVERFEELDAERVERTFRVNIIALFHLVRHALAHMRAGGTIINVSSIQAYEPSPAILDYAVTKGAVVTFTKGLARELITRGIRVNSVAPGPVWTPLIPQSDDAEGVRTFGQDDPMGRPAQPAELAPAFVFLASEESRYINGEILGVTGGRLLD